MVGAFKRVTRVLKGEDTGVLRSACCVCSCDFQRSKELGSVALVNKSRGVKCSFHFSCTSSARMSRWVCGGRGVQEKFRAFVLVYISGSLSLFYCLKGGSLLYAGFDGTVCPAKAGVV